MPYTLTEARIVRGSVPYLAPVIAQFGNPWVLGSLTLATRVPRRLGLLAEAAAD